MGDMLMWDGISIAGSNTSDYDIAKFLTDHPGLAIRAVAETRGKEFVIDELFK